MDLRRLEVRLVMLNPRAAHQPTIVYRPVRPSDLDALEQIHAALFPIRYEREFFLNVVNSRGIVSWAAVDVSGSDDQGDKLVGFVTTRIITAKDSEIADLLRYTASRSDLTLVYILTLGVVEHYRNVGIATKLVHEVIKYASSIAHCRAVYLHVIAYNQPAICFYKKMSFKLVRRLRGFYYIKGQHHDSYLFVYYVNGGRSPCSPLEIVAAIMNYFRALGKRLAIKLWRDDEKNALKRSKCKEISPLQATQSKRIIETASYECV